MKKNIIAFLLIMTAFNSCKNRNVIGKEFSDIHQIKIYSFDSIELAVVSDKKKIQEFTDNCLTKKVKTPLKFRKNFTILLVGAESEKSLYINGDAFVWETYTYLSECNIENYLYDNNWIKK